MILRIVCLAALFFISAFAFGEELTPEGVLSAFESQYASITDYQCRLDEWCSNGKAYEKRLMYYFFKKPRMIRTDIIEGNKALDAGSAAVYTGGKEVSGRKGGLLSGIVVKVDKKDPLVTTVRGMAMDEGDLQAILEMLRIHARDTNSIITNLSNGDVELIGYSDDPSKSGGITKEVLIMDGKTFLPKQADEYEGDKLVIHSAWSGYILNAGLPDEVFNVKFDIKNLKKMGIQTVK